MNVFRKVVLIRCSGQLNAECENYKNKVKLRPGLLHCPECGSRIVEDKVINRPVVAASAAALAVVLAFGAYRVYRAVTSTFEAVESARRVTNDVVAQFKSVPELKGLQIRVGFSNGVLTLTGEVSTQADKEAAEAIARKVGGVKQVVDQLLLAPAPPQVPVAIAPSPGASPQGGNTSTLKDRSHQKGREEAPGQTKTGNEHQKSPASAQQNPNETSLQVEQINNQQEQLKAAITKQQQQELEIQAQQTQLQEQQQKLEEEVKRLAEEKAKTPAAPPTATAQPYNGPSSGTILWEGKVSGTQLIDIINGHSAQGTVTGNLPGVPCMVQPTDPKHVSVAIGPIPESGWKRVVIRVQGKGPTVVRLTWTVLQ